MTSAEARAAYAANNCFTHAFRNHLNSSDHLSSDSEKVESDSIPGDSIDDHSNSGCKPHDPNCDRLPNMKWWLHVKTNLGGETNYTCQHLNSWESELDAFHVGFLDDNVKVRVDQATKNFDALSCIGSANIAVEQPWNGSHKFMKNNNDTVMPKIEAALNNDLRLMPKKKDEGELWFLDAQFVDCDLVSKQCKKASSDLKPHWMGAEKTEPWWCTAGKDELASLVVQKSFKHLENCDLPHPQIKYFRERPSLYPKGVDHDKNPPSSLNQKTETCFSNSNGYTSGTLTSGCSFQGSEKTFGSSLSTSDSSIKDDQINSDKNSKAELLKALCHSQTRAREAENAAQQAFNEKEHILSLFFRQASQLFAYKQWFQLLQLENLCLQLRNKNQPPYNGKLHKSGHRRGGKRKVNSRRRGVRKCALAFAVGLGLAGVGVLLGLTMGWMFPPL